MKKKMIILVCALLFTFVAAGTIYARTRGNVHYKAKCIRCSCTEFVSDKDSYYKCYNCGHADYCHRR